ncbi:MAG: ABC transporter substrate-binding protein [Mediterraneibacter faecis]
MKRKFSAILTAVISSALLFGSASSAYAAETTSVGSLKGPTSMGIVQFMSEQEASEAPDFDFTMVTAADELVASFTKGDTDIALLPANVASVLYNKTKGNVQVLDINTLGVLYLVTADTSITGVADLKGKTLYSTGKGQTPEYALNYLLDANGLSADDVTVEYKSEPTEVVSILAQDETAVGVLPQPFATVACQQNDKLQLAADLTAEWDKTNNGTMVTGVTIAKKDFVEANPEIIDKFLTSHSASTDYVNTNTTEAAKLVASYGIVEKAPIAEKALPKCNITCMEGEEMKEALSGYLNVLFEQNPESVGGALPEDDFYYSK